MQSSRNNIYVLNETSNTRDRLLSCARDIYLGEGMAGLTMRKVAKMAGVSAPAIYRHFDSKEALLAAIVEEGFRLFGKYTWHVTQADTPRQRLLVTSMSYLRFALEETP